MKLPTGTVTFLFTDIERSTRLLDRDVAEMRAVLIQHHDIVRTAVGHHGGVVFETVGDAVYAAFETATNAINAAVDAQRALLSEPDTPHRLLARMAVHTGEVQLREKGHYVGEPLVRCARLLVLGHGGQTLVSGSAADLTIGCLPPGVRLRDLGSHKLKDLERRERVYQLEHADLPPSFPALVSMDVWPNNLPAELSSFIGRTDELSRLAEILPTTRLLTLTGAGGSGKTRLAIEVASRKRDSVPHGAWFVDLATLTDGAQILPTTIKVLGLAEQGQAKRGSPDALRAALVEHLRAKRCLLILDNCEHLLEPAATFTTDVLTVCAGVRVLATSREQLGIRGETIFRVPGLAEAVELFVERARSAQSAFVRQDTMLLERICDRLDRMPLAIELAAARISVLSIEDLAVRLDDRFRILTGATRSSTPRQQTLRATVDWSHSLLSEAERVLWRRCGAFPGSFSLSSAEAILGFGPLTHESVLDLVASLVNKSLITASADRMGTRFRLLETLREYASERLGESSEAEEVRRRHAEHFLEVAERESAHVLGGEQQQGALDRLESDIDNFRAAMRWAERNDQGLAVRLGIALSKFLLTRGHFEDAVAWVHAVVPRIDDVDRALRGEVLYLAGVMVANRDDYAAALDLEQRALEEQRATGDQRGISNALRVLAVLAEVRGETDSVTGLLEQSLAHAKTSGSADTIANAQAHLARARWRAGDYAGASAGYEQALQIRREMGDRLSSAPLLQDLAYVESDSGRLAEAERIARECVALNRELGAKGYLAVALNTLGNILRHMGRLDESRLRHEEALAIANSFGDGDIVALSRLPLGEIALADNDLALASAHALGAMKVLSSRDTYRGVTWCYDLLGRIAIVRNEWERAARLQAAAVSTRARIRLVPPPFVRAQTDVAIASIKAATGDSRFAELWSEGTKMTRDEATIYALAGQSALEDRPAGAMSRAGGPQS